MKFGRNLPRNQVPEWASSYINYKGLKKLIKGATDTARCGGTVDTAGMLHYFVGLNVSNNLSRILLFSRSKS